MQKSIIMILFLIVLFLPLNQVSASMELFDQIGTGSFYWDPDSVSYTSDNNIVNVSSSMDNPNSSDGHTNIQIKSLINLNEQYIKTTEIFTTNYKNINFTLKEGDGTFVTDWQQATNQRFPDLKLYNLVVNYVNTHQQALQYKKDINKITVYATPADQISDSELDQPKVKIISKSTLEWTLYKTINLAPGKSIKINIPTNQWQISPASSFIQITVDGEDGLYFNKNGISGDTILGCGAGNYVIKSESAGEIKIMIQNQ
jgi:hypothetical protein